MKESSKKFWGKVGKFCMAFVVPILLSGIIRAIGIYIFVTPNHFAPGGVNGIAVLIEYGTGLSAGIWLAVMNVPLFFICFFFLGKREAVVSTGSMLASSGLLILFDYIPGFKDYQYVPANGFLAAVAGGIFLGIALAVMVKSCGTSGGTTVLASIVHKKYKNLSVSALTSAFDACVVFASFFVYNRGMAFTDKLDPVLLALVSLYVTSKMCDVILQGFKSAYKFEIVTNNPEEIANEIMEKLHHGVTSISAEGMYSHTGHSLLVCVIRKRHIAELQKIIKKYPGSFAYFAPTNEVFGKFIK